MRQDELKTALNATLERRHKEVTSGAARAQECVVDLVQEARPWQHRDEWKYLALLVLAGTVRGLAATIAREADISIAEVEEVFLESVNSEAWRTVR